MKVEEKTLTYKLYTNDSETQQIREIKGISIMNRKKNKEGKWIPKTRYINDINDSNQIVILLDKNKPITKENTIVADRHILGYMVGNKYFDLQPKLKHLAIKNCQLKEILDKEK